MGRRIVKLALVVIFSFVLRGNLGAQCLPSDISLAVEGESFTQLEDTTEIPRGTYLHYEVRLQKSPGCAGNLGFQMPIPDATRLLTKTVPANFSCDEAGNVLSCFAGQVTSADPFTISVVLKVLTEQLSSPEISNHFELTWLPEGGDADLTNNIVNHAVALNGLCGNGFKESFEECDDGATANGDGCSNLCSTEKPIEDGAAGDSETSGSNDSGMSAESGGGCSLGVSPHAGDPQALQWVLWSLPLLADAWSRILRKR